MPALNVEQARFNMIEQQVRPWDVFDLRVLDTLREVRREDFVPPRLRDFAFADLMLPIGHGQVMMSPIMEGRMLQALGVQPGERVLEIGTGTGFTAACLAHLGGEVLSVDIFPDFTEAARRRLAHISFATGDASTGWEDGLSYDAIAITGAVLEVPEGYLRKLNQGGRLFVIAGQAPAMQAWLITREGEDAWRRESLFETVLPYLVHAEPRPAFTF